MKILLYGMFGKHAHRGSGAWCYRENLNEMGHDVAVCPYDIGMERYQLSLPWRVYRRLTHGVLESHRRAHSRELLERARAHRADIVIVLRGLYVGPQDVAALKRTGAWVVNVNHDDFFSLNPNNWSRPQRAALSVYDYIFATRAVNVEEIRPLNPNVEFFGFAYYPRIHRPLTLTDADRERFGADVSFVGTWETERAGLLEYLVLRVPARYSVHGSQWHKLDRNSPLQPYVRPGEIFVDDMARAIGAAKISLGFLRKKNRDEYTQRTFEVPACGGLMLAERTAAHLAYYVEDREAAFFDPGRPDELVAKVRHLLEHDEEREAMRRAGMAAVERGRHTYRDRLNRLFELHAQA